MPGRDLVLLHGFTQTGASWDGGAAALGGRYRALRARPPGPRRRAARRPRRASTACDGDVRAPAERFVLAGYSMGGRLALALALRAPARGERLVLVGASPGIADAAERAARRAADAALADRIEAIGIEAFAREWARAAAVRRPAAERSPRSPTRTGCATTAAGLAAALRGLGTGRDAAAVGPARRAARCRSTLVVGERDAKFRAIGRADAWPRCPAATELLVVPGAGHAAAARGARARSPAALRTHPEVP